MICNCKKNEPCKCGGAVVPASRTESGYKCSDCLKEPPIRVDVVASYSEEELLSTKSFHKVDDDALLVLKTWHTV